MKPVLSPLILRDFAVTENRFTFLPPNDEISSLDELFNTYLIDIDFEYSENEQFIAIAVQVQINYSDETDRLPGYSFMVEGTSIFEFQNTEVLSHEDKASLLNFSGLSITINHIRGFVATLTSYAPFGRYNLPTIDVNNLLSRKNAMVKTGDD